MLRRFQASSPRSVLYVEDQMVNVLLMQAIFRQRPDLHLVVAGSGEQALQLAPGLNPALLLLDLQLPDCHGTDLLPLLRRVDGCERPPAITVTSEKGFSVAGTDFVELWEKPLKLAHTLSRLESLLGADAPRPRVPAAYMTNAAFGKSASHGAAA